MKKTVLIKKQVEVCEYCGEEVDQYVYHVVMTRKGIEYKWCSIYCFERDIEDHVNGDRFDSEYFASGRIENRRRESELQDM